MSDVKIQPPKSFYRYTDIIFEWSKPEVIPDPSPIARSALRGMLSNDALVHPDHPLRLEGDKGIRLYIGTTEQGYARLLFSAAQVEYLRYWLHAMEYTESLLPLPSSDYILTEAELRNVTHNVYESAGSLKKAVKQMDKTNKRLKGSNPLLTSRRLHFDKVRNCWAAKTGTWLAIDLESWERDHSAITEFGWSDLQWTDGAPVRNEGHLTVLQYRTYRNGMYIQDNRERYMFGKSEEVPKRVFAERVCALVRDAAKPLFLVFHDPSGDVKDLTRLGVDLDAISYNLPDGVPEGGTFVIDTRDLFAALEGDGGDKNPQPRSLDRMCRLLGIETEYLHNAGNDAHYTFAALESMASAETLDAQRERRWPTQTTAGFNVAFAPWQEDSDHSDMEGVIGVGEREWDVSDEDQPGADAVAGPATTGAGTGQEGANGGEGERVTPYGYDMKTGYLQFKPFPEVAP